MQSTEMLVIRGGRFRMGSDRHYPEEGPAHDVIVDDFEIDESPVTNARFAAFVAATGHVTLAEIAPDPADYPGMPPEMARPGSLLFVPPPGPVNLADVTQWWQFAFDVDWRRPAGSGSSIEGMDDHPVVHIAYPDALAYAEWVGKALPTEAEWEYAARGGLDHADYAWGEAFEPEGAILANYWHGDFPWQNLAPDGFARTSPVGSFPANGFGLHDMIGNVWEWTSDWYSVHPAPEKSCCVPRNPRGPGEHDALSAPGPGGVAAQRVLKGGSHLCAPNYCQRYRPAARTGQTIDTSTSHIGFRCVRR